MKEIPNSYYMLDIGDPNPIGKMEKVLDVPVRNIYMQTVGSYTCHGLIYHCLT